jgi:hypothetical protein
MDKKFGPAWQVVVGKGFSYDVQYEVRMLETPPDMHMRNYDDGTVANLAEVDLPSVLGDSS